MIFNSIFAGAHVLIMCAGPLSQVAISDLNICACVRVCVSVYGIVTAFMHNNYTIN